MSRSGDVWTPVFLRIFQWALDEECPWLFVRGRTKLIYPVGLVYGAVKRRGNAASERMGQGADPGLVQET